MTYEMEIKNLLNHLIYNEEYENKSIAKELIVKKFIEINKTFEIREKELWVKIEEIKTLNEKIEKLKNCGNCFNQSKYYKRHLEFCPRDNYDLCMCDKWEMEENGN